MPAVSARKRAANRRNAQFSTGPKTSGGKTRSSRNATTHGVFSADMVLPDENGDAFDQLRTGTILRFKPRDVVELQLVNQIIAMSWRLDRLRKAELEAHAGENQKHRQFHHFALEEIRGQLEAFIEDSDPSNLDVGEEEFITEGDRDKLKELLQRTADSEGPPPPFVPLTAGQTTERLLHNEKLERFSRYESRLQRELYRAMAELRKLKDEQSEGGLNDFTMSLIAQNEPTGEQDECNDSTDDGLEADTEEPAGDKSTTIRVTGVPPVMSTRDKERFSSPNALSTD